ncbi:hypothetical protein ACNHE6_18620 [Enterobacter roggenkampii]|uniref:hypothetical protein n=1 Tax=Enterobacter roggenkampii TaxID=1812935 RepID=UPI003A83A2A6
MSAITKQWLQQKIADMEATRDEIPFGLDEDDSNTLAAMKLALASIEAEAVAYADPQAFRNFQAGVARREWMWRNPGEDLIPVYTSPPAPECLTRPVPPRISSEELDDETLDELIDFRRCTFEYHSQQGNKVQTIIHGVTLTAMLELRDRRAAMIQGAEPVKTAYELPMQPLVIDAHGTLRFKENPIIRALLDYATEHGYGLNEIAREEFDAKDQMQLAQLIGYSLSGYGTLSYVTDESYERAAAAAPQQEVKP